ncbi:hypothetical protein SNB56_21780 [Escherichia coli]|nr:hypothetical protein [Escherichia coli]MEA0887586.1 hypothetical protein [Escherichia coli]
MICSFLNPRQRIEGAKGNTREQRGHIAPKRGAAADRVGSLAAAACHGLELPL